MLSKWMAGYLVMGLAIGAAAYGEPAQDHGAAGSEEGAGFEWTDLPDAPHGMGGHFAGVHNGALIIAGGTNWLLDAEAEGGKRKEWLDTAYALEADGERWHTGSPLPAPVAYGASGSTSQGVACVGGADADGHLSEAFLLAWEDGELTRNPLPSLPQTNAYGSAAVLDDVLYVAGGLESPQSKAANHAFWALDLKDLEAGWKALEPWPGPARILSAMTAAEGAVYLFTGRVITPEGLASTDYLPDAYRYTPGEGWETLPAMPKPATAASAAAYKGSIYIFSGDDGVTVDERGDPEYTDPGFSPDILKFDLAAEAWSHAGTIPETYVTTHALNWQDGIVIPCGEPNSSKNRGKKVLLGQPK